MLCFITHYSLLFCSISLLLMSSKLFSWFSVISLILTTKLLILFQPTNSSIVPQILYYTCNNTFTCGERIRQIRYPFRGTNVPANCGHPGLVLECDHKYNLTTIKIMNITYFVLDINQNNQTMRIFRPGKLDERCLSRMDNTTLDYSLFDYADSSMNVTLLYGCPDLQRPGMRIPLCENTWESVYVVEGKQDPGNCKASAIIPVLLDEYGNQELMNATRFSQVLSSGFEIKWMFDSKACTDCVESNGRCGFDFQTNHTTCLCHDQPFVSETCLLGEETSPSNAPSPVPGNPSNGRGMQIGLPIAGAVLTGMFLGLVILYLKQRRKQIMATKSASKELVHSTSTTRGLLSSPFTTNTKSFSSYPSSKSEFGTDVSYFGVQVFDLSQLQEATDNFNVSRELGDGGFGTVYYGELPDGCKIAVKRLYNNNFKRVEQYMNEVEILARLRHQNLVKLYGCTPKRSRELLLVYEYIPNGTVADHLHGNRAKSGLLSWPIRLNIAIETAQALIYLHKSDIIHRDVKTCNILLDNDFHVKVADFGLSRLFPTNVTHVSTAPQGTPGYVDPEYYQCYQLTEKSDVYSFGVVLIELISSLQAVDTNRHRHDINLSIMAMNKIQNHKLHELVDSSLGFGTNSSIRRMTTLVAELGFRCLQQERDMRPSMDEVLESLIRIENEDSDEHMIEIDIFADEEDIVPLNSSDVSSPD